MRDVKLEKFVSQTVGDGKSPNWFFVTDAGECITATRDFTRAYAEWKALARRRPMQECTLEDRHTGVIAGVEPETDEKNAPLIVLKKARGSKHD